MSENSSFETKNTHKQNFNVTTKKHIKQTLELKSTNRMKNFEQNDKLDEYDVNAIASICLLKQKNTMRNNVVSHGISFCLILFS